MAFRRIDTKAVIQQHRDRVAARAQMEIQRTRRMARAEFVESVLEFGFSESAVVYPTMAEECHALARVRNNTADALVELFVSLGGRTRPVRDISGADIATSSDWIRGVI
jgi:hypothetical protein